MLHDIAREGAGSIRNEAFRAYAGMYADIERDFLESVRSFGLDFAPESADITHGDLAARVDALAEHGARVENDRKSIHMNWISPACLTCRKGVGTETFLASTQCPRDCYFCFNPNQEDYGYYLTHVRDLTGELKQRRKMGVAYKDLALTGGEPLLHADESVAFFERARAYYPGAYLRLYTSGSPFGEDILVRLEGAGLDEIRFSVKLDEPPAAVEKTLDRMRMCVGRIPSVMVEMPVMPDQVPQMKELLVRLDDMGVRGINLLELCFPFHNAGEFARRGYRLKARPYRVLYNYLYAGGVPVDGSEAACVELLEFALDEGLGLGVHYCSLENKFTGQVYQQNTYIDAAGPWHVKSTRDHFLKSAKVFGDDVLFVQAALSAASETRMRRDRESDYLEFPLEALEGLAPAMPDLEVGVSLSIAEQREEGPVLREVGILKTTPAQFDPREDV